MQRVREYPNGRAVAGTFPRISVEPTIEFTDPQGFRLGEQQRVRWEKLADVADNFTNLKLALDAAGNLCTALGGVLCYVEAIKISYQVNMANAGQWISGKIVLVDPLSGQKQEITESAPFNFYDDDKEAHDRRAAYAAALVEMLVAAFREAVKGRVGASQERMADYRQLHALIETV